MALNEEMNGWGQMALNLTELTERRYEPKSNI